MANRTPRRLLFEIIRAYCLLLLFESGIPLCCVCVPQESLLINIERCEKAGAAQWIPLWRRRCILSTTTTFSKCMRVLACYSKEMPESYTRSVYSAVRIRLCSVWSLSSLVGHRQTQPAVSSHRRSTKRVQINFCCVYVCINDGEG